MFRTVKKIVNWCGEYKSKLYIGFIFSFFSTWFASMPIMISGFAIGKLIEDKHSGIAFDSKYIWLSLLGIILCIGLRYLFDLIRARLQEPISYYLVARDRLSVGDALKRVSLGYFEKMDTGRILSSLTTGLKTLESMGIRMCDTFIGGYLNYVCVLIFLLIFNWKLSLITVAGVFLSYLFLLLISFHSKKNAPVATEAEHNLTTATLEYAKGLSVVKSFGQEGASISSLKKSFADNRKIRLHIEWGFVPFNALHLMALKMSSVILAGASCLMYYNGEISITYLILFCLFSFIIFAGIEPISDSAHVLGVIDDAFRQMEVLHQNNYIDSDGIDIKPENYNIEFKNVSFGYDNRKVIDNISFSIPQNTSTAIVGPSGSGKSTICSLLARFYDVNGGEIIVGGHNVKEYTCDSLLKNISMVFQKVYLFNDTIRNNICFGRDGVTEDEMITASKKARCHDFIMALPQGYDTVIGEGGDTLSGGEKQRISIARAILKDSPIIIFDEATASVDPENEHLIQSAISELTHGKTIITIAHRLATIENSDQILVVDNGKIVERGTHKELINIEGVYKDFIKVREKAEGWSINKD